MNGLSNLYAGKKTYGLLAVLAVLEVVQRALTGEPVVAVDTARTELVLGAVATAKMAFDRFAAAVVAKSGASS